MRDRIQTVLAVLALLALMASCAPLILDAMEHEQIKRSTYEGRDLERDMAVNRFMEEVL